MKYLKILLLIAIIGVVLLTITYFVIDNIQEPKSITEIAPEEAPGSFINLSEGRVHYQFHGPETGELIILVHGGGVTGCHVWDKTIPALTDAGYRVFCYDLYGRGYSDRPETVYNPELLYRQFSELLNSLEIEKPFYLFGQSLGAMVATDFTVKHPEKVKKLIYVAPAILGSFSTKAYLKVPLLSDLLMTFYWSPRSVNNQMEEFYSPDGMGEYREKLHYFKKFEGYKDVNLSTWLNTYTVSLEASLDDIGANGTAVLLVMGNEDPLIPVHAKSYFENSIANLSVHVINKAGHMPHYEKPEEVNIIILDFL